MNNNDILTKGILALSELLNPLINWIILILFIGVLAVLVSLGKNFRKLEADLNKALTGKKTVLRKNDKLTMKQIEESDIHREEYYKLKTTFYDELKKYDAVSGLVPLFPLFGILGTVSGLISQVGAQGVDSAVMIDTMLASLNVALTSTFAGLVAAIVLKIVETCMIQSHVSAIEATLEDYSEKYEDNRLLKAGGDSEQ